MKKQNVIIICIAVLLSVGIVMYILSKTMVAAMEESTYINENGAVQKVNATILDNTTTLLTTGWYIVKGNVSTTNLIIRGETRIILEDDSMLTAVATENHAGIEILNNSILTVYGQTLSTGKLNATGSGKGAGIGGYGGADSTTVGPGQAALDGGNCGTVTIVGGIVTTSRMGGGDGGNALHSRTDLENGGKGGNSGIITIKGGNITVTDKIGGGDGGKSVYKRGGDGGYLNKLTISGGVLNVGSICGGRGGDGTYAYSPFPGGLIIGAGQAGNGGNGGIVDISGGKVNISGNIGGGNAGNTSVHNAFPGYGGDGCAVTIGGGTIHVSGKVGGGNGSSYVGGKKGSDGSCIVTGGSFTAGSLLPVPTNGNANGNNTVSLTTIVLSELSKETKIKILTTDNSYTYGIKDMYTNAEGKVYIWIQDNTSVSKVYAGNSEYTGMVTAGSSGILSKMPPDIKKPTVVLVNPLSGSVNVPTSGNIIITFSETVEAHTGSVSLIPSEGSSVVLGLGTWSSNNTVYKVSFTGLTKGVSYTIAIDGFADFAGNIMVKDTTHDFRVEYPIVIPVYDFTYVDELGTIKTASVFKIDSTTSTLSTGWYAVEGSINLSNLTVSGNVRLILADGSKLTVSGTDNNAAIRVGKGNSLTIYGQTLGTGTISAVSSGRGAGIGGKGNFGDGYTWNSGYGEHCGTIIIFGGTVFTNRIGGGHGDKSLSFSSFYGGNGGTVTINGGKVTVSDRIGGGDGGNGVTGLSMGGYGGDGSILTINGGVVTVSGKVGGGAGGSGALPPFYIPAKAGNPGTCTITGGSVQVSNMQPTSKNNNVTVSRTTITLGGVSTSQSVKAVVTNLSSVYGTRDMKTDESGKLYLWLPTGAVVTEVFSQGNCFRGSVQAGTTGTLVLSVLDIQNPVITLINPVHKEEDVPLSGSISVTFSKVMDVFMGNVTLSVEGSEDIFLTGGKWSYSGTVYTFYFSGLSYSREYTVNISGFKDISGHTANSVSSTFTTVAPPKSVSVGTQSGTLISDTSSSAKFTVDTISIESSKAIILNNINNIEGISIDEVNTTGDNMIITIRITDKTPAGTHPLSLTIDNITSNSFNLVVDQAVYSILLSQTEPYDFASQIFGYDMVDSHSITVMNTGNLPTGVVNISLSGEGSGSFILSETEILNIDLNSSCSFTIRPDDGLPVGIYSATVTVSGINMSPQSFDMSFSVDKRTGNNINSVFEPQGATIIGTNIFANVENDVSTLLVSLSVSDGATWRLYRDVACLDEFVDKTMSLSAGANIAFVEVTAENGDKKLFALVIIQKDAGLLQGAIYPKISESNGTLQLETELDEYESVIWSIVSGHEYATINSTGLVTAKDNGIVIIHATVQDSSDIYQEFMVMITGQSGTNPNTGDDLSFAYVSFILSVLIVSGTFFTLLGKTKNR